MLFRSPAGKCGTENEKPDEMRSHRKRIQKIERKYPHIYFFLARIMKLHGGDFGKASLCALQKGWARASLAVETALVLPLFFLGMITLISFMDIYRIQTEHLVRLCGRAKEAGMYAYGIAGGGREEITLPDVYSYRPIGGLAPLPRVWMYSQVTVRAWTGKDREQVEKGEETKPEVMVYVTENGQVYHRSLSCTYLKLSVTQVPGASISSLRNLYGEKYHACEACSQGQEAAPMVYITEKGNRYHNKETCSGLKRTLRLVKESEVKGLRPCPRCG